MSVLTATQASTRPYEIVVWGATGFVGRLVSEHIAQHYQGQLRWALAGRNSAKLEALRSELVAINPACREVPILLGNTDDQASIDEVVRQTDVVIAVAGPFARHGTPLVDASARLGSHYCDITGEVGWVQQMYRRYNQTAAANGAKIVNFCGYDSIPSDLGTLLLAHHAKRRLGKQLGLVRNLVTECKGAMSGGTAATILALGEAGKEGRAWMSDPYALNPPGAPYASEEPDLRGHDQDLSFGAKWCPEARRYMVPFLMAPVNTRVVRSSAARLGYGPKFQYVEGLAVPGLLTGVLVNVATVLGAVVIGVPLFKPLAKAVLPSPGSGPTKEQQITGRWRNLLIAQTDEPEGTQPTTIMADLGDDRDPGYWGTARMVLEAGLCLARDAKALREAGLAQGGVLTPAAALGMPLIGRLESAGMFFRVQS